MRLPHPVWALLAASLAVAPAAAQDGAAPVTAATVERVPLETTVTFSGTVAAPRTARVSVAVAGKVVAAPRTEGERVAEGDTLVKLDSELAHVRLREQEAGIAQTEAELSDLRRQLRTTRELAEQDNAPQNEVRSLADQVRAREAALTRRRAERDHVQAELDRHTVEAPFPGVVSAKPATVGEWLTPGDPVVRLVGLDRLRVEVPVPQKHYAQLDRDTPVSVSLAGGARRHGAEVLRTVPVTDPQNRTFTAHVRVADSGLALAPGMAARAHFTFGTGERGPVVPRDAVIRHPDGRETLWVLPGDGETVTVEERVITTGVAFDGRIHVREGVEAGERVVVQGNAALRPGQRVRVQADS